MDNEILKQIEALVAGRGLPEGLTVDDVRGRFLKGKGFLGDKRKDSYIWFFERLEKHSPLFPRHAGEVNEFMSSLQGLGDESRLLVFKALKAVSRYLSRTYGWVDVSVNAERPKVEHKRRRYFDDVELKAILGACRDVREKTLVLALLDSSARVSEVAGLTLDKVGADFFLSKGKTGQRRYRCDRRLVAMMHEIAVGGVVFPLRCHSSLDKYVEPIRCVGAGTLSSAVNNIMKRAGLTGAKLGAHTLRHTAGSLVARKTMSALAVRAVLQQDSVKSAELYIHDVDEGIQQEVSPLELSGLRLGVGGESGSVGREVLALAPGGVVVVADLVEDLFPEVPDGLKIRPALSSDDLRLIRDGLVGVMRASGEYGSGSRCVVLMRRMMRRV